MTTDLQDRIAAVVAAVDLGKPSARKGGRRPEWPYVPVILRPDGVAVGVARQEQIKGKAFATRAEAVGYAARTIEAERGRLAADLAEPRYRALREQHGLPREVVA